MRSWCPQAHTRSANAGPWKKLAARKGATIKLWNPRVSKDSPNNPYAMYLDVEDLLPLITSKTRLVAFTACSNILGSIVPVKAVISAARARAKEVTVRKIEFSVDCVAYAPHRRIDVQDWDVDFCFFSFYKVRKPRGCRLNISDRLSVGIWTTHRCPLRTFCLTRKLNHGPHSPFPHRLLDFLQAAARGTRLRTCLRHIWRLGILAFLDAFPYPDGYL